MPRTQAEIVAQLRASLRLSEPDLDTSIGQPVRKMLDAIGEVVAEAEVDKYLLDYQYDIDSKRGPDLDEFVRLFGFTRLPAKRAVGSITFERATAGAIVVIPYGTQLATDDVPAVVVSTIVPAVLGVGETSISVPVQAVLGGSGGNIPSSSVTRFITPVSGVLSMTNPSPLTGGADEESDEQLRLRFKKTVFRNMAGTEQMFLGIALENEAVTHANVVGPVKRFREQVEVIGGEAVSTIQDAKQVYAGSSVFGPNIDGGDIRSPEVHYRFNLPAAEGDPPSVTVLDATQIPDGIYDLSFEYVSAASRNDPSNGITNRVDVYVNGDRPEEATEVTVFRTARVFSVNPGDPYYFGRFRTNDGTQPAPGDYFLPLTFVPIFNLPNDMVINGQTWAYDGAPPGGAPTGFYKHVWDETAAGRTPSSLEGILLESTQPVPGDDTPIAVTYNFNAVPRDVEDGIRQWRLLTTDARVHQAKRIEIRVNLVVILASGYTAATVRPEIEYAVGQYLAGIDFNGVAQTSDVLAVVHAIAGVDAVRFVAEDDNIFDDSQDPDVPEHVWGWEKLLTASGGAKVTDVRYATGGRAIDALFGDDELPVLNNVTIDVRAQNTYGVG